MTLNLKKFNKFLNYKHIKMESINNVVNLITSNVYMASIFCTHSYGSSEISKIAIKNFFQFTRMLNVTLM